MSLSLIVAMSPNRVIGKNNQIPWHVSEDLKHFKKVTMGHPIIMGRKTFESLGKPLEGRYNIVITRKSNLEIPGIHFVSSLDEALKLYPHEENFVIGGAQIYKLALPKVNRIVLTLIHQEFEGDTFFPEVDWRKDFFPTDESPIFKSAKNGTPYQFFSFVRSKKN